MSSDEHDGDGTRNGGGGAGDEFGREEPTKVESQRAVARVEGRAFAAISDSLDAAEVALERVETQLARVAPARRLVFLRALILRLGQAGDAFHELRRDYQALLRLEEARKDEP